MEVRAQAQTIPTGFWRLYRYSGELKLNGFYREQQRNGYQFSEKQQTTNYMAGLALRTQSYFWHPRFITLDVDAEYTPARSDEKFLVIPDQAETRDVRKADIRLTILPQHKYSLVSYLNYSRVYNNRENLSNIRSSGTNWGSTLFMRSKFIPFSLGYTSWDQQEDELLTGRSFLNRQKNVEARFNKSFGSLDKQELLLSRNYFFRSFPGITFSGETTAGTPFPILFIMPIIPGCFLPARERKTRSVIMCPATGSAGMKHLTGTRPSVI